MRFILTMAFLLSGIICMAQSVFFNNRFSTDLYENAWSIYATDTSYVVFGSNGDNNFAWDIAILSLDLNGNTQSLREYDKIGVAYYAGGSGSITKTNDGGYCLAGSIEYGNGNVNALLWKFNEFGDSVWTKEFGDSLWQAGIQCKQSLDGGYIVIGATATNDSLGDFWLIKTDSAGNLEWDSTYGASNGYEYGTSVDACKDGGYVLTGPSSNSSYPYSDIRVIKTDSVGNVKWDKKFGGQYYDNSWNVQATSDGGYIVCGNYADAINSWPDEYYSRPYLIKLDSAGNKEWEGKYGISAYGTTLFMVRELSDGNFIAAGQTTDSIGYLNNNTPYFTGLILKVDSNGDSIFYRRVVNLTGKDSYNYLRDIRFTSDGGFIAAGWVAPNSPDTGTQDMWVLKLDSCGCDFLGCDSVCQGLVGVEEFRIQDLGFRIYPNPATGNFYIQSNFSLPAIFKLYDIFGREIMSKILYSNYERIDGNTLRNGIYAYCITDTSGGRHSGKLVIGR